MILHSSVGVPTIPGEVQELFSGFIERLPVSWEDGLQGTFTVQILLRNGPLR